MGDFINVDLLTRFFSVLAGVFAVVMLLSHKAITCAVSLLGILLCTAFLYAMMSEHFLAAIQLVVYAGAIMVFFIFSIMLLNFKDESRKFVEVRKLFSSWPATVAVLICLGTVIWAQYNSFLHPVVATGTYTPEKIVSMGGNTVVLAEQLFTTYSLLFEVVAIVLLIALIAAVVLAKRKFD